MKRPWIALALLCLAVACGGGSNDGASKAADGSPRSGGTAVLGSISDVDNWNPFVSGQSFAGNLLRRIWLPLAREAAPAEPGAVNGYAPELAESWSYSDDGRELTFRLREATWSDGRPVTSDDVVFTWEAQTSSEVPWRGAGSKSRIVAVEAVDPRTVRFTFDGVYPFRLADAVEGPVLPRHVFGVVPFGEWVIHDWSGVSVGSGPFLLERYAAREEIVLVRNPRYFREGFPRLDRVVVRVVPDGLNLLTQLETGAIDYLEGIAPRDADRLSRRDDGKIALIPFSYPEYEFIAWNGARPPFDDVEVRRALTMAIDREAIVRTLLFGYGQVASGPVPTSGWGAAPDLAPWPYDPDEARRLLAARGYGPDRPLGFTLVTNGGNELRRDVMVLVQDQLSRVGVQVDVSPMEPRTMQQQVGAGEFEAVLAGFVFVGKVDLESLFHSRSIGNGMNFVHYDSPEVDALLDAAARAETLEAVREPWLELQRRIARDVPYTFLFEDLRIAGHGPRLHGVVIDRPEDPLARLERFWVSGP